MSRLIQASWPRAYAIGLALVLAGCQVDGTAPVPPISELPAPTEPDMARQVDDVAAVGIIEVSPLADPDVAVLVDRARIAELRGELSAAEALLRQALELAPRDPDIWQRLAELHLLAGEWAAAASAARTSFDTGPKIGRLCVRNWITMARAFRAQAFDDRASHAEREADDCPLRARERL